MSDPSRVYIKGILKRGSKGNVPSSFLKIQSAVPLPIDSGSGMPVGRRRHSPIIIVKHIDTTSSALFQAFFTGKTIGTVIIDVVDPTPSGKRSAGTTLNLHDVLITQITKPVRPGPGQPKTLGDGKHAMEEIQFTFQSITYTRNRGSKTASDDWLAG